MYQNLWIFGAVCFLAACASGPCPAEASARPNILYINIDDLGWRDVGFMGSTFYQTPNLDRLAKQGMVFTNAYAPASNCAPSRACCMSGQYTPRHGVFTVGTSERGDARTRKLIPTPNRTALADQQITIAEALKTAGYRTIHLGKWHLGKNPRTQGFDVNIGGNSSGAPRGGYFSPYKNPQLPDGPKGEHLPHRLAEEAVKFLEDGNNRPFFMYFSMYSVHTPLQAPKDTIAKYKKRKGGPGQSHATYGAMVEHMDQCVGRVLTKLDELGLTDDTLVLFCSDNGGIAKISSQAPLRAGKGAYYEGGIREPMIVRWPGKTKPDTKCDVPVHGVDFFPTFLEAAGVSAPRGKLLDGVSIVPLLTGKGTLGERALFWHFPIYLENYGSNAGNRDPLFRTRPGSVVRLGNWKLHEYFEDGELELYNLETDLGETTNLADKRPDKVKELHGLLKQWRKQTKAPVPTEPNPKYDAEFEKKKIKSSSK